MRDGATAGGGDADGDADGDPDGDPDDDAPADPPPAVLPIDGTLDLHTFSPRDVHALVPDYLAECRARGVLAVRLVHGKGTGTLRRHVHAILARLPEVAAFRLADETGGGWGATLVELRPVEGPRP